MRGDVSTFQALLEGWNPWQFEIISDKMNHWIDSQQNASISLGTYCSLPYGNREPQSLQQAETAGYRQDFWNILYKCETDDAISSGRYRLIDKYMRQPPALSSGVHISRKLISRVWTFRKVK
jgi:hypothetical protein